MGVLCVIFMPLVFLNARQISKKKSINLAKYFSFSEKFLEVTATYGFKTDDPNIFFHFNRLLSLLIHREKVQQRNYWVTPMIRRLSITRAFTRLDRRKGDKVARRKRARLLLISTGETRRQSPDTWNWKTTSDKQAAPQGKHDPRGRRAVHLLQLEPANFIFGCRRRR